MFKDVQRCSKMFKGIQSTPSFQLPKNSLVVPCGSNPKRLGITWDHVLKACPWSHQPPDGASSGFCRPGPFVSSGKKDLWQWKIHRLHMVFPWKSMGQTAISDPTSEKQYAWTEQNHLILVMNFELWLCQLHKESYTDQSCESFPNDSWKQWVNQSIHKSLRSSFGSLNFHIFPPVNCFVLYVL